MQLKYKEIIFSGGINSGKEYKAFRQKVMQTVKKDMLPKARADLGFHMQIGVSFIQGNGRKLRKLTVIVPEDHLGYSERLKKLLDDVAHLKIHSFDITLDSILAVMEKRFIEAKEIKQEAGIKRRRWSLDDNECLNKAAVISESFLRQDYPHHLISLRN